HVRRKKYGRMRIVFGQAQHVESTRFDRDLPGRPAPGRHLLLEKISDALFIVRNRFDIHQRAGKSYQVHAESIPHPGSAKAAGEQQRVREESLQGTLTSESRNVRERIT